MDGTLRFKGKFPKNLTSNSKKKKKKEESAKVFSFLKAIKGKEAGPNNDKRKPAQVEKSVKSLQSLNAIIQADGGPLPALRYQVISDVNLVPTTTISRRLQNGVNNGHFLDGQPEW